MSTSKRSQASRLGLGPVGSMEEKTVTGRCSDLDKAIERMVSCLDEKFHAIDRKVKKLLKRTNFLKRRLKTCTRECQLNHRHHLEFDDQTDSLQVEIKQVFEMCEESELDRKKIKGILTDYFKRIEDSVSDDVVSDAIPCDEESWDSTSSPIRDVSNDSFESDYDSRESPQKKDRVQYDEKFLDNLLKYAPPAEMGGDKLLECIAGKVQSVNISFEEKKETFTTEIFVEKRRDSNKDRCQSPGLSKKQKTSSNDRTSKEHEDFTSKKVDPPKPTKEERKWRLQKITKKDSKLSRSTKVRKRSKSKGRSDA